MILGKKEFSFAMCQSMQLPSVQIVSCRRPFPAARKFVCVAAVSKRKGEGAHSPRSMDVLVSGGVQYEVLAAIGQQGKSTVSDEETVTSADLLRRPALCGGWTRLAPLAFWIPCGGIIYQVNILTRQGLHIVAPGSRNTGCCMPVASSYHHTPRCRRRRAEPTVWHIHRVPR